MFGILFTYVLDLYMYILCSRRAIFYVCNLTVRGGGIEGFAEAGSAALTSLDLI